MGKVMLAVALSATLAGGGKSTMAKQQLFSCNPDPPVAGQPWKVTYSGTLPRTIEVTRTPGGTTGYTITTNPIEISVPIGTETINVVDLGGFSEDLNRLVQDG